VLMTLDGKCCMKICCFVMNLENELDELATFAVVAEERSFTRAAKRLASSQSALSHTVRRLERRLDLQLLARTTRSVSPTPAGEAVLKRLVPALAQIRSALAEARSQSDQPAGRIRLMMSRSAAPMVLLPRLAAFARDYPDIVLDVQIVSGPSDLVAGRFDAGILVGNYVQRDMAAVRLTPDLRFAVFGSPGYFASHPIPKLPRDLAAHSCIGYNGPAGAYRWEFRKGSRTQTVSVHGPLLIDDSYSVIQAALAGIGLGLAFETQVTEHIARRQLVPVLEDWCPPIPGFFLYYPSRRNQTAALAALIKSFRQTLK
jgi:DNA-binding transcriptional LysR family regulator